MGLIAIMFLGMILGAFLIAKGLKNKKNKYVIAGTLLFLINIAIYIYFVYII